MRHRISGKKLGRTHHQRQALLKSLARAIFTHGSIDTTKAKSQAVIPLVEKVCRLAQKGDLSSRRRIFSLFQDKKLTNHIVTAVTLAFKDQVGNFTKTKNVKKRLGDDALIVKLEFTKPYSLTPPVVKEDKTKKDKKSKPSPQKPKAVKKVKAKSDEK
jgi:large subunit ribosomal protein L17